MPAGILLLVSKPSYHVVAGLITVPVKLITKSPPSDLMVSVPALSPTLSPFMMTVRGTSLPSLATLNGSALATVMSPVVRISVTCSSFWPLLPTSSSRVSPLGMNPKSQVRSAGMSYVPQPDERPTLICGSLSFGLNVDQHVAVVLLRLSRSL